MLELVRNMISRAWSTIWSASTWTVETISDGLQRLGPQRGGILLLFAGLALSLPVTRRRRRMVGWLISGAGAVLWAASIGSHMALPPVMLFWLLAGITVGSAIAAVTMTSAVYSAVWFALTLAGVAGLLVFQGSAFLGMATLVVYAGAIVVTLLFVLMLAEPRGHSTYDRLSWGRGARWTSPTLSAAIVLALTAAVPSATGIAPRTEGAAPSTVARLGARLFARHLVEVELAGMLLLVALVGAVAIVLHGRTTLPDEESA